MRQLLCPSVVGREPELELLEAALDEAGAGRGRVVLLSGEAGVGKSRLVREAIASARQRRVLGPCRAGHGLVYATRLRPRHRAFLTYFRPSGPPEVPGAGGVQAGPGPVIPQWRRASVLAEAVLRLLATVAGERGCLLILEDLHWADPETIAIVDYFSTTLDSERVLCVGSLRGKEPGAASALQVAAEVARSQTARMSAESDMAVRWRCTPSAPASACRGDGPMMVTGCEPTSLKRR